MIIDKMAKNPYAFKKVEFFYENARTAMRNIIEILMNDKGVEYLLLPAYIGISPKEGSGIMDPVNELTQKGLKVIFYKLTNSLDIDMNDFMLKLDRCEVGKMIALRVNYFGFIDKNQKRFYQEVKRRGGWLIEDCAHAYFSTLYSIDVYADVRFFSLHKQFPFEKGGMLRVYDEELKSMVFGGAKCPKDEYNLWHYDAENLAKICRQNYECLDKIVKKHSALLLPLKTVALEKQVVPQTYPVRLLKGDRFKVYLKMNEAGYGVTSLYHTMIPEITREKFPISHEISANILNLPVHQDVNINNYPQMINKLINSI